MDQFAPPRLAFVASLPIAAALNAHWFTVDFARFTRAEQTFARMAEAIDRASRPTGTGEFAPLLLAAGVIPTETGHTPYFRVTPAPRFLDPLWDAGPSLEAEGRRFVQRFYSTVDRGAFDLVLANRRELDLLTPDVLSSQYRVVERLDIDMPWARQAWPVDVWVPRSRAHLR